MTKRMLIDATHAEETRVVVLDGNRLEDFDVETSTKKQLKGNIYLAKVVRVEPSLQAAFVEYGGNRHGFLAFGEIHPDYYQIPVADRQRLLEAQAEEAREEEEEEDRAAAAAAAEAGNPDGVPIAASSVQPDAMPEGEQAEPLAEPEHDTASGPEEASSSAQPAAIPHETVLGAPLENGHDLEASEPEPVAELAEPPEAAAPEEPLATVLEAVPEPDEGEAHNHPAVEQLPPPETVGGEGDPGEERDRRIPPRFLRNYKIQEVIKRRQILLVQVVKEERGTKGAALTTYISLAGRYCVLMPNSPRGGGISRKITSAADRRRLKEITAELEIPRGMGLIVRTAGANRPKPEIKRDCEYLIRLWDDIREHTMKSVAPAQIYEEASLIKRSIRDVYSRDLDEIVVDGEDGWKTARDFMRMLMPSHAKKVQIWRDNQSLFARHQIDTQLDAMMSPTVQLKSGGYLVINQAEALVAIDVNSGRSTRERGIEETALRTNLEAADEVARQLRLRDLAGLIVIDFIDMESKKHNSMVERRFKDALKDDRARLQVGHISHFGLLEMSRQRLRPSLAETSLVPCPHCGGSGHVRSTESAAIHVLRQIEDEGAKRRSAEIVVHAASSVALYILNHKRERLAEVEARHGLHVTFAPDEKLISPEIRIERVRAAIPSELPPAVTPDAPPPSSPALIDDESVVEEDDVLDEDAADDAETTPEPAETAVAGETAEEAERRRRRRRRRRRGGRREDGTALPDDGQGVSAMAAAAPGGTEPGMTDSELAETAQTGWPLEGVPERADDGPVAPASEDEQARGRGRNRRGGRRRRREGGDEAVLPLAEPGADQPELPAYTGPTPANPFGGQTFDIFDLMDPETNLPMHPTGAAGGEPGAPAAEPEPVPRALVEAAAIVPTPEPVAEAKPVAEPEPVAIVDPELPQADPAETPEPANDTVAEATVQPILVGADQEPAPEKKRGWWRR